MVDLIKNNWLLLAFLVVLVGAFLLLRSTPSDVQSIEDLNRQLTAGRPTVLAFYSNF
jgi:hypothetical protein